MMSHGQAPISLACPVKPTRHYRITPRDIAILHFIGQNGFATGGKICKKFFGNANNNLYLRRLRKLKKMGLIDQLKGDQGVYLGYIATRLGRARLADEGIVVNPGRMAGRFRSTYDHDLMLQDIREILEKSPLVSDYHSEAELRSEAARKKGGPLSEDDLTKVPDGCFTLKCPSRVLKVALELELATKTEQRYRKMLRALCTLDNHNCAFVLSGRAATKARLECLLKDVRARDPYVLGFESYRGIYFGLASEFLAKGHDAKFYGEGKTFTLAELAQRGKAPGDAGAVG